MTSSAALPPPDHSKPSKRLNEAQSTPEQESEIETLVNEFWPFDSAANDYDQYDEWLFKQAVEKITAYVSQAKSQGARDFITQGWGKRCKTKDLVDFPDLKDHERCACCEMWEHYDEWLAELTVEDKK